MLSVPNEGLRHDSVIVEAASGLCRAVVDDGSKGL